MAYQIYLEIFGGGYGASAHRDGCDAVDSPLSNCGNVPVEAMDMEYDFFRVEEYGLRPDSGGAGRYRGGLGFSRRYLITKDDVVFATYADRFRIAPEGLYGGGAGETGRSYVERAGEVIDLVSKQSFKLEKGDVLVTLTGGGAGYGDPARRQAALKARDLADGLVTPPGQSAQAAE